MSAIQISHPALLVIKTSMYAGKQFAITHSPFEIGRSGGLSGCIPVADISRLHAIIRFENKRWYLVDSDSTYGTFLNHQRIPSSIPQLLVHGDEIRLGAKVELIFNDPNETSMTVESNHRVGLWLDVAERVVYIHNHKLDASLSQKQFDFLKLLYQRGSAVVSIAEIEAIVWPEGQFLPAMLDALVKRLREKLATLDPHHDYIGVVRGVGRRFIQNMCEEGR